MTPRLLAIMISIGVASVMHAEDEVTAAPKGTYRITQHYADGWDAILRFRNVSAGDVPLAADPDRYPWPAIYHISSDDEWILRIQKTGSGENSAFLYHVERSGRVWRMAQRLDELAFAFVAREHIVRSAYYHTGVEFLAWDLRTHSVRFRLTGTPEDGGKPPLDRHFVYHLDSHQLTQ